ncbi:MAG: flagellar basal body rod protein FlgC [Candidatus Caenarcaniphilales bacterium]|nr:flagellar basal body rod protein FlgC [Candidatus Caenarcaniphilales bacterium]
MYNYDTLDIAGSALRAERLRMDVIAGNIANMNTTHNADGMVQPYIRKLVSFKTIMDEQSGLIKGVAADGVMNDTEALNVVYDPSHPDADDQGYVYYPNISIEEEMTDMISAKAAYEANITTIRTYKEMFRAGLEL